MTETIILEVTFEICYEDKEGRKKAIKRAKECVMGTTILSTNGAKPIENKLKH